MYMKSSANVVSTKIRTLYGKRLTIEDYEQLINQGSISGIARYLKNETSYGVTLASINENFIHRGQLELLLNIAHFEKYINFFYYKTGDNINIFKYIVLKNELEEMITAIRLFNTGKMEKYATKLPVHLLKYTKIDLKKISTVKNFDDLLEITKGSIYYEPLKEFDPKKEKLDIVKCEIELRKSFYKKIFSLLDKNDKLTKKIFLIDIETYNVSTIYRLKKFFYKDNEYIKSCLLPFYYHLNEEIIDKIISAYSVDELYNIIAATKYRKYCSKETLANMNFFSKKILFNILSKDIRFINSSQYIIICYMYLNNIELKNIITIIECVGYKFSFEEIKKLLIV